MAALIQVEMEVGGTEPGRNGNGGTESGGSGGGTEPGRNGNRAALSQVVMDSVRRALSQVRQSRKWAASSQVRHGARK